MNRIEYVYSFALNLCTLLYQYMKWLTNYGSSFDCVWKSENQYGEVVFISAQYHSNSPLLGSLDLIPALCAAAGCMCLRAVRVSVFVCGCVCAHLRKTFNTHRLHYRMFSNEQMDRCSSISGIISPPVLQFGMDFFFLPVLFSPKLTSPMRRHRWSGGCNCTDLRRDEKAVRCCNTAFDPI